MAFLRIQLFRISQSYECFHIFDVEYWWKWPYSINLYANMNCLTSVRLNVRCWIWSKSNSETTCYSLEIIQILALVSQVIDIHSSQWEFTNFGGLQVSKFAPDMRIFKDFLCFCEQYTVILFTLKVSLPCLEREKIWF